MLQEKIKAQITAFLKQKYDINDPVFDVLPTNNFKDGDLYTNVALKYGTKAGVPPLDLAEALSKDLTSDNYDIKVVKPGFINFYFTDLYLAQFGYLSKIVYESEQDFEPVLVEYSSPNIAKPFGVGHLRSTFIGASIVNLLKAVGKDVITDNHLGDWGTQYGKLAYAVDKWGDIDKIKQSKDPIKILVELYIKFHDEADKDPQIEDAGREYFKKLETGDSKVRELWQFCVDVSLKEFNRIYDILDIPKFDYMLGESFFEDKMQKVLQELRQKGLTKKDKGAELVYFDESKNLPPMMVVKKDGTTLYSTRDLATDKNRFTTHGSNTLIINEVGAEQSLYFQQLFETEKMLGWVKPGQRIHVKHGLFRLKSGKMSTRKGKVVLVEDILEEAQKRSLSLISSDKSYGLKERANIAREVAVGALKWNDLKREAHKDVVFDWDEVLNMKGNSGPYVQYTYARCQSVLAKAEQLTSTSSDNLSIANDQQRLILRLLARFNGEVIRAAQELSPHYICHYIYELCQAYNSFYAKNKIIGGDNEQVDLLITKQVSKVVKNGLNLLGIKSPNKM